MTQGRVSIGEMARRLGVAVVTLRRWDREGKLKPLFRIADDELAIARRKAMW